MAVRRIRLLVLVDGPVGSVMAGPEIRGWELARALSQWHKVTVAARGHEHRNAGEVEVIPYRRSAVSAAALRHDAVLATWFPPYLLALLAARRAVRVADLYDPVELELAATPATQAPRSHPAALRSLTRLQLRHADLLTCATRSQRDALRPTACAPVIVVPLGLPPPPPSGLGALRERFPAIREGDGVALWWGSIWPWLDPLTAIDGFAAADRDSWHLVFAAGVARLLPDAARTGVALARERARELGLLGRTVHFIDEWIPYDSRHQILADADVGLTLARDLPERRLAARARYMDYLWAGLPCVLSRGDEIAGTLAEAGCAQLVAPEDSAAVAQALARFADEPSTRLAARAAAERLARDLRWPAVAEPLATALGELPRRRGPVARTLRDVAGFYVVRALGRSRG